MKHENNFQEMKIENKNRLFSQKQNLVSHLVHGIVIPWNENGK